MVLIMTILRDYYLKVYWNLMMVKLGYNGGKVIGSHEYIKLGYTDGDVIGKILGNRISRWQY